MEDWWQGWTAWESLKQLQLNSLPERSGAYAISAPCAIQRVVGTDFEGILHVGESAYLRSRVKKFRDCALGDDPGSHMAGWRYRHVIRLHERVGFAPETLRVRWIKTKTKKRAYAAEARALVRYLQRHCELPPLNYKFNWDRWDEVQKAYRLMQTSPKQEKSCNEYPCR